MLKEIKIPNQNDRAGHAVSGSLLVDGAVEDQGHKNWRSHVFYEFWGHTDEPPDDVCKVAALLFGVPDGGLLWPPEHAKHVEDLVEA